MADIDAALTGGNYEVLRARLATSGQELAGRADALNTRRKAINGSSILVAGVAYKRDIDDLRESPALDVMGLLHERGANIAYADPYVTEVPAREWSGRFDLKAVDLTRGSIGQYDCVVIVTDHKAFDYDAIVAEADLVVDTRNAIKQPHPNVFRLGAPRPAPAGENIAIA
jgi:UDP-N-acetyl-D-glucosamine dehydrogenase